MGDFNYPVINWENMTVKRKNPESQENTFVDCIQGNYLYQHVNNPTRWRGTNKAHILDLILTNEAGMIQEMITKVHLVRAIKRC